MNGEVPGRVRGVRGADGHGEAPGTTSSAMMDGNAQQQGGILTFRAGRLRRSEGNFGGRGMSMDDIFEEVFTGGGAAANAIHDVPDAHELRDGARQGGDAQVPVPAAARSTGRPRARGARGEGGCAPRREHGHEPVAVPGQGADGSRRPSVRTSRASMQVGRGLLLPARPAAHRGTKHVTVPMTLSQAVLGGKIDVLTLDGMVKLTVPSGGRVSRAQTLIMRVKGIREVNAVGRSATWYVNLELAIPRELTVTSGARWTEFASEERGDGSRARTSCSAP